MDLRLKKNVQEEKKKKERKIEITQNKKNKKEAGEKGQKPTGGDHFFLLKRHENELYLQKV